MNAHAHQFVSDFHDLHGINPRLPGPVELTADDRFILSSVPPAYRAAELIRIARDDFKGRFPIGGSFASLAGKAQDAAWKQHCEAYIAAAVTEWIDGNAIRAGMEARHGG